MALIDSPKTDHDSTRCTDSATSKHTSYEKMPSQDIVAPPALDPRNLSNENSQNAAKPNEIQNPKGITLFIICVGLALSVTCVGLDRSILSTAIPRITEEFNSLPDLGWYGSAYLLTSCCFQLPFGKLFAEFSIKWVYLAALGLFELGSLICALAPNSTTLIIGRAVAGLGSAGIFTGVILILSLSVPLSERPKYTGVIGGCSGVAQVVAPFLGGVFTDKLNWRWCFWINLPMGVVTLLTVLFFVRLPDRRKEGPTKTVLQVLKRFDFMGTLFLLPGIICLLLALEWGGSQYTWSNWRPVLLLCLFSVMILVWAYIQWKLGDNATLPLRIIRMRSMGGAVWFTFCFTGVLYITSQYVPIWLQAVQNVTAYQSGIDFLTVSASMAVVEVLSGFLTSKIGYFVPQMYVSVIISSIASGLICRFTLITSTSYWIGSLILFGVGAGLGVQQPLMVPQTMLPDADISLGISLIIFTLSLGGAIFLPVGTNIFQGRLISELETIVPQVNPQDVIGAGAGDLAASIEKLYPQYVGKILEAYNKALQSVFLVSVVLSALAILGAIVIEVKNLRKKPGEEVGVTDVDATPAGKPSEV